MRLVRWAVLLCLLCSVAVTNVPLPARSIAAQNAPTLPDAAQSAVPIVTPSRAPQAPPVQPRPTPQVPARPTPQVPSPAQLAAGPQPAVGPLLLDEPRVPSAQSPASPAQLAAALGPLTPQTSIAQPGAELGAANPSQLVHLAVALKVRDQAALQSFLQGLYDPQSPDYEQYLTPAQFTARFIDAAARAQVDAFLHRQGLQVQDSGLGSVIDASGTVAQVQQAFHVQIDNYQTSSGTVYASTLTPALPAALGSLIAVVSGLDDLPSAYPDSVRFAPGQVGSNAVVRQSGTPSGCSGATGLASSEHGYLPNELASAYDFGDLGGQQGQGQSVALVEFEDYAYSNIQMYANCLTLGVSDGTVSQGAVDVQRTVVDGPMPAPSLAGGETEVELDIEDVLGLAPHLTGILVYETPNTSGSGLDEYQRIANDDSAKVVSSSWGSCEPENGAAQLQAQSDVMAQSAAEGQTIFAASGDDGSSDCYGGDGNAQVGVRSPSDSPYATGVGGTTLSLGSSNSYSPEAVWNSGSGAGGGGVSAYFTAPTWQTDAVTQTTIVTNGMRMVPDVSADADPATGYVIYTTCGAHCASWQQWGGTSAGAPLWAAGMADIDSYLRNQGRPVVGWANPVLYSILRSSSYATAFHDVRAGNNCWVSDTDNPPQSCGTPGSGLYAAGPGYDPASGIGSPDFGALAAALLTSGTTTTLTESTGPALEANTSVTLTATVQLSGGTAVGAGTVTFVDGGVPMHGCVPSAVNVAGKSTCTTTLSPGARSIVAAYSDAPGTSYQASVSQAYEPTVTGSDNAPPCVVTSNADDGGPNTLRSEVDQIDPDCASITFSTTGWGIQPTIALSSTLVVGALGSATPLTIDGSGSPNVTLQGNGIDPLFTVFSGRALTLRDLTLTGGGDGAIYNAGQVNLDHDLLTGNSSPFMGGAIFNDGIDGSATIGLTSTTLFSNTAPYGGAIYNVADAGNADVSLDGSTLGGQTAGDGNSAVEGGAIYNDGWSGVATVALSDTALLSNTAIMTATDSLYAESVEAGAYGGAVFNDGDSGVASFTASGDTQFIGNTVAATATTNLATSATAAAEGGAIYNDADYGSATVAITPNVSAAFDSNATTAVASGGTVGEGDAYADGGAVYNDGLGGAASFGAGNGTDFLTNSAVATATSTLTATAMSEGGAIYNDGGDNSANVSLTGVALTGNYVSPYTNHDPLSSGSSSGGGAIFNNGDSGTASIELSGNTVLQRNSAIGGSGGAIYNNGQDGTASLVLTDTELLSNTASMSATDTPGQQMVGAGACGGAIYNVGTGGMANVTVTGATQFIGNTAVATATTSLATFASAWVCGGAVYNGADSGNATFAITPSTSIVFSNNTAAATANGGTLGEGDVVAYGGAVFNVGWGGAASFSAGNNTEFIGNSTPATATSALTATTASEGGAIYNASESDSSATISLSGATLMGNYVAANTYGSPQGSFLAGGAIYNIGIVGSAIVSLGSSSIVEGNQALGGNGGAIDNESDGGSAAVVLTGTSVMSNTAASGGAIWNDGGSGYGSAATLSITGTSLVSNTATTGTGGAVSNAADFGAASVTLSGGQLFANSATSGGAIWSDGGAGAGSSATLEITGTSLVSNTATSGNGGAIDSEGDSGSASVSLSDGQVLTNTATFGGAIYNDGGADAGSLAALSISGTSLVSNTATTGSGGAIENDGGSGTASVALTGAAVISNTAVFGGAVLNYDDSGVAALAITSSTLYGNSAIVHGNAIYNDGSDPSGTAPLTITASTLSNNNLGGVEAIDGSGGSRAPLTVHDSVLADSASNECSGAITYSGYNLALAWVNGCGLTMTPGSTVVFTTAQLFSTSQPTDNGGPTETLAPVPNSLVIGRGDCHDPSGQLVTSDQRGVPRPTSHCTIGAVEESSVINVGPAQITAAVSTAMTAAMSPTSWLISPVAYAFDCQGGSQYTSSTCTFGSTGSYTVTAEGWYVEGSYRDVVGYGSGRVTVVAAPPTATPNVPPSGGGGGGFTGGGGVFPGPVSDTTPTATPAPSSTATWPPMPALTSTPSPTSTPVPPTATVTSTPWVILGSPAMAVGISGSTGITLTTTNDAVAPGQTLVLHASVASASKTSVGSVSFMEGRTVVGNVPVVGNVATIALFTFVSGAHLYSAVYHGPHGLVVSTGPMAVTVGKVAPQLPLANQKPSVQGGVSTRCSQAVTTRGPFAAGCEAVFVTGWLPGASVSYTLDYADGTSQAGPTTMTTDAHGNSHYVFAVAYRPPSQAKTAKQSQPTTSAWISVVGMSKDRTEAKSHCLRFTVMPPPKHVVAGSGGGSTKKH